MPDVTPLRRWMLALALSATAAAPAAYAPAAYAQAATGTIAERYRAPADRLIQAALRDSAAYERIAMLADSFGNRPAGSASLEAAIDWVLAQMKRDGLQNVHGEPVMVPHWVRGAESVELLTPHRAPLHMLGLGGSIGTPPGGITAPVLVVSSFDDLARHAAEAKGKIVLFDYPFPTDKPPFAAYEDAVRYRSQGAIAAARVGAVASLIRSVASFSIQSPHTGGMRYDSGVTRIPHAALSVEDAAMLHRLQDRGEPITLRLTMGAHQEPDAPSRNVVAEITGSERPDEVVVLGGHIDSWDVGEGAMDDAGGSVAAWQALRLIHDLGLRPRRTIRVVLWTNEEFGGRGGRAYRQQHQAELGKHVLAMESDNGVFTPHGFRFVGSDSALAVARQIGSLLDRIGSGAVNAGEGEADIGPLIAAGVPGMALDIDGSRYFWYHHSAGDMPTVLNPHEVALCVATMAVMAYVVADLPEPLARSAAR